MRPAEAARWHANIHIVKMIVETAQLLCNVHHRAREASAGCDPPYTRRDRVPYRDSAAGHRKLGSMIWVAESLGNYRWAVCLGLALCKEYNRGRGRAKGKTSAHRTQAVLEWLRDHEPNIRRKRRTPVQARHLAMPDKFKKAASSVEAYRDYYFSKRRTMAMEWPEGRIPPWWEARKAALSAKRKRGRGTAQDSDKVVATHAKRPKASSVVRAPTDVSGALADVASATREPITVSSRQGSLTVQGSLTKNPILALNMSTPAMRVTETHKEEQPTNALLP